MSDKMFTLYFWLPWFKRSDVKLSSLNWPMIRLLVLSITVHWYGGPGVFFQTFYHYWAPGLKTWSTLCGWWSALKWRLEQR